MSEHTRPLARPRGLVDAQAVAECLAVDRDWVYAHADELGVLRLGRGLERGCD
jgi:hypothetical protein